MPLKSQAPAEGWEGLTRASAEGQLRCWEAHVVAAAAEVTRLEAMVVQMRQQHGAALMERDYWRAQVASWAEDDDAAEK